MRENKKTNVELFKEKIDGSDGTNWNGKPQADYVTGELRYRKDQLRGYHLRVSIQTEGDGFIMFTIGSGVMLGKYIEQTARFNEKRLVELAANTSVKELASELKAKALLQYHTAKLAEPVGV